MYSGTDLAKPGVTLHGGQLSMRILARTPELKDLDGLTVALAPPGAAFNFEAWAVTRPDDSYTTFEIGLGAESRVFAMARRLTPERWLLEFLAWEGSKRVETLVRGLDAFQLTDPKLELDALVPVATDPLRELLNAGFDVFRHDDGKLHLRRPVGLDALQLAARWRH